MARMMEEMMMITVSLTSSPCKPCRMPRKRSSNNASYSISLSSSDTFFGTSKRIFALIDARFFCSFDIFFFFFFFAAGSCYCLCGKCCLSSKSFRLDCLLFGCWYSPSYTTRSGGRWRRRGKNHGTRSCLQTRHPDERTNQVRKLPPILSLCLSFFVTTYGCSRIQWPVFATSCVCSEPFSWLLATWICRESVSRHKSDNGLCIYVCVQYISVSGSLYLFETYLCLCLSGFRLVSILCSTQGKNEPDGLRKHMAWSNSWRNKKKPCESN